MVFKFRIGQPGEEGDNEEVVHELQRIARQMGAPLQLEERPTQHEQEVLRPVTGTHLYDIADVSAAMGSLFLHFYKLWTSGAIRL